MYVIVLMGASNSGKTYTLIGLRNQLVYRQEWQVEKEEQYGEDVNDHWYVLTKDNKKIGIITFGDIQKDTKEILIKLQKEYNVDIAIMAYNEEHTWQVYNNYKYIIIHKSSHNKSDVSRIIWQIEKRYR